MPAKVTATFTGAALRYDDVPIVDGGWSINVDTTQLPNSTAQNPTIMEVVPTDAAGNIGSRATRAFVVANAVFAGTVPPLTDASKWRARANSTIAASSAGLTATAIGAGNVDVDNNVVGSMVHVTAGAKYDIEARFTLSSASASRVAQLGVEWTRMGTDPSSDGFGGAGVTAVSGDPTQRTATIAPGASATVLLAGVTAPPEAARLRIIARVQNMLTGETYLLVVGGIKVTPVTSGTDTTPPSAAFSSPAGGATVMGVTTVSGTYSDPA